MITKTILVREKNIIEGDQMDELRLIEAFFTFGISFSELRLELFNKVRPQNVTPLQFEVMLQIHCKPNAMISEISAALEIAIPNASREVKKLIDLGYLVSTQNSEDRRKCGINLTDEGEVLKHEFNRDLGNLIIERFQKHSESDVKDIITSLETLNQLLK